MSNVGRSGKRCTFRKPGWYCVIEAPHGPDEPHGLRMRWWYQMWYLVRYGVWVPR